MFLTIIAATPFEISPIHEFLKTHFEDKKANIFEKNGLTVQILITGVGIPLMAYSLGQYFSFAKPDLAINAGIAGAFPNGNLDIGDVVNVVTERFADLGIEKADGTFEDVHEAGLIDPNEFPFENGILFNPTAKSHHFLPQVNGLTINKVHGTKSSIAAIRSKYDADIESMEGAAFFLAALNTKVEFLEIRAISNYVEPRNKNNWNIPLAIDNLNRVLIEMINSFIKN